MNLREMGDYTKEEKGGEAWGNDGIIVSKIKKVVLELLEM